MNLVLSIEAIKCLINDQRHRDFNPYSVGSLIKEFMPHLSYSDLACVCQVKRHLYEGKESVVNLLILDGMADNPPPTMAEIKKRVILRKTVVLGLKHVA